MTNDHFHIRLPDGGAFTCRPGESVLAAMQRYENAPIRYGCFGGGCGVCRMRVVSGTYHQLKRMSRAHVTVDCEREGIVLMCCITPLSDLTLAFSAC
ncbi:2Fe-2S iron-sulfur cluster binding domain-containing protein [Fusibacter paucivorans]|uniref:2Fe-2S iron-sulfur cluster binding domain-containing protein n=1 Tax=Fusibacter paucivorans TaxID=76009 RepID=A0ABS5PJX0_9FIRM|nr:2Fe-2S iron-sulfur cluster-binding protein [Fusibacter paucivorans]MBS7525288.1 2Fe-2S iron-sulfur cluster binding domain-containing protein [Fusibacter paucivorans]